MATISPIPTTAPSLRPHPLRKQPSIRLELADIQKLLKTKDQPLSLRKQTDLKRFSPLFPIRNKVLVHYELLKRSTEMMDPEQAFTKTEISIDGTSFPVYDTQGKDFCFLVHAVKASTKHDAKEAMELEKKTGLCCASLISQELSDFYQQSEYYAIVLAVHPQVIIKTTPRDAFTPYKMGEIETRKFYDEQHTLQILAAYIDELYRNSVGLKGGYTTELSQLKRLLSLKKIDGCAQAAAILSLQDPDRLASIYLEGETQRKVEVLLKHFRGSPDILKELMAYKRVLQSQAISPLDHPATSCYRSLNPLLSPHDLLAQTAEQPIITYNQRGSTPYNELNLDLRFHPEAVQVRAILIDREAFSQHPYRFLKALQSAKKQQIPILLKGKAVVPLFQELQAKACIGDQKAVKALFQSSPLLHLGHVEETFIQAARNGQLEMMLFLLDEHPKISPETRERGLRFLFPQEANPSVDSLWIALMEKDPSLIPRFTEELSPIFFEHLLEKWAREGRAAPLKTLLENRSYLGFHCVSEALITAAEHQQLDCVKAIVRIKWYHLSETSLKKAIRLLCQLPSNSIPFQTLDLLIQCLPCGTCLDLQEAFSKIPLPLQKEIKEFLQNRSIFLQEK